MATLQDLVGLTNPQAASPTASLQQGMQLASQANQLQAQQDAHAQATDQLETMKFNKAMTNLSTLARTRPEIAKRMVPKMQDQLNQAGIPVDQGVLESMASDEDYKQRFNSISAALQGQATDPSTRAQALQAFGDIGEFDKGLSAFESQNKLSQAVALKDAQIEGMKSVAGINAQGRVDAAGVSSGPNSTRAASLQERSNNDYSKQIYSNYEKPLEQAARATTIIDKIQVGDLKSTKTLSADLDSAQASLLGGGKPSTVYGQQAVHMDDIYTRAQNAMAFITAHPQDTQSPAKLAQLKLDVEALRDFYGEQHANQYSQWRQGQPDQVQAKLDNRFNKARQNYGLPAISQDELSASGPTPGTQAPPSAPQGSKINLKQYPADVQAKIKQAQAAGYSDADILARIK